MGDDRLRKAWKVGIIGYRSAGTDIYFGPSSSKVRYNAWSAISEVWDGIQMTDVRVWRAAWADVQLPPLHPIVDDLTPEERHIILHSYGAAYQGPSLYRTAGRRDHFFTREGDPPLCRLVERGLMTGPHRVPSQRDSAYFYLNWMGKRVAESMVPTYA